MKNKVKIRRSDIRSGNKTYDNIYAYYIDPNKYKLTDAEERIRKRWLEAYALQLNFHNRHIIASILQETHNISEASAYSDVRNSMKLFGMISHAEKEGIRSILYDYSQKLLKKCVEENQLSAAAKAIELMGKYGGANSSSKNEINPDRLRYNPVKFSLDPKSRSLLNSIANQGVIDFNDTAEDVEYIEDVSGN